MRAYATPEELVNFLSAENMEAVSGNADRLLVRASELIDTHVTFPYLIDDDTGLPTDETIAAQLRDACCAQVEFWLEVGEENDIDGLAGTDVNVTGYSGKRPPVLGPRPKRILSGAGLFAPYDGRPMW